MHYQPDDDDDEDEIDNTLLMFSQFPSYMLLLSSIIVSTPGCLMIIQDLSSFISVETSHYATNLTIIIFVRKSMKYFYY